jgi:hypothetical protein
MTTRTPRRRNRAEALDAQVVLPHPLHQLGGLLQSRPGAATTSGTERRFRLRDSTSAPQRWAGTR